MLKRQDEEEVIGGVIVERRQANLQQETIKLTPEMELKINEWVVGEVRSIMKTQTVQSSRRYAMYLSGLGTIVGGALSVIASALHFDALANLLLTPTIIGAISAATLAYLLQRDVD